MSIIKLLPSNPPASSASLINWSRYAAVSPVSAGADPDALPDVADPAFRVSFGLLMPKSPVSFGTVSMAEGGTKRQFLNLTEQWVCRMQTQFSLALTMLKTGINLALRVWKHVKLWNVIAQNAAENGKQLHLEKYEPYRWHYVSTTPIRKP